MRWLSVEAKREEMEAGTPGAGGVALDAVDLPTTA
jgi:hypothetical protein